MRDRSLWCLWKTGKPIFTTCLFNPDAATVNFMIRAEHNRKVQHELNYLIATIEHAQGLEQHTIELERQPERPARSATSTVRTMQVAIEVPRHHKQLKQCPPVTLGSHVKVMMLP